MDRRSWIVSTGALVLGSHALRSRSATHPARIGILLNGAPDAPLTINALGVLRKAFGELGWVEGRDVAFEPRYARGALERLGELAAELVALPVEVILALGGPAATAAKKATERIPVV